MSEFRNVGDRINHWIEQALEDVDPGGEDGFMYGGVLAADENTGGVAYLIEMFLPSPLLGASLNLAAVVHTPARASEETVKNNTKAMVEQMRQMRTQALSHMQQGAVVPGNGEVGRDPSRGSGAPMPPFMRPSGGF